VTAPACHTPESIMARTLSRLLALLALVCLVVGCSKTLTGASLTGHG